MHMKKSSDISRKTYPVDTRVERPDPSSAGQSGDDMGLPTDESVDSESVAELAAEGQYFEAEAIDGMDRPYPDEKPLRPRRTKEDDVPFEYPARDSALDTD